MSDDAPNAADRGSELNDGLGAWVPAHERVPAPGTECVVLVRYTLDRPPFCTVDKWDVQREDPTGMGGPTIETGEGWNDNYEADVIAWIAIPPHPPAEWDQRLSACGKRLTKQVTGRGKRSLPKVRVDRRVGRQRGKAMYYCNKCGHMGEDGPGHCKPTHYLGHLTACDYDAALVPDADQMPLHEMANVMARHLPDGWEVSLCMERGAAWVTLHNPEGDAVSLPDAADKSLTHQLSDALVMAYG